MRLNPKPTGDPLLSSMGRTRSFSGRDRRGSWIRRGIPNPRPCRKAVSPGVTLLELVVVLFVMGFSLLPILKLYFSQTKTATDSWVNARAAYVAATIRSRIAVMRWDENGPAGTTFTTTNPSTLPGSLGVDFGETAGNPTTFDDLDDWNGFSGSLDNYSFQVQVVYLTPGSLAVSPTLATALKQVQITVTQGIHVLSLPTVYANQ